MAKIEHRKDGEVNIAVVSSDEKVAVGLQSALDLAMAVKYETDASRIVMSKKAICDSFFILSSGVAGQILQKFIHYQIKIAVYGDFTQYTSQPLKDFLYESNQGHDFFLWQHEKRLYKN